MLLPFQGAFAAVNQPRALPWAMCLLGFQPVHWTLRCARLLNNRLDNGGLEATPSQGTFASNWLDNGGLEATPSQCTFASNWLGNRFDNVRT